jgi:hypothetical protein
VHLRVHGVEAGAGVGERHAQDLAQPLELHRAVVLVRVRAR